MIEVKTPLSPLELSIVSGIDDMQANHIKFHNISFCCDRIEDCEGRVFIQSKKSKLIVDDFNTEIWGANSNCGLCGCSWQINDHGVDNFCPNCGVSLREGGEE